MEILNELIKIIDCFTKQEVLPTVIQNVGIALLTVYIAVAIFLVEKDGTSELDKKVLLRGVIKAKKALFYLLMFFLPLLLWEVLPSYSKLLVFFITVISFIETIKSLNETYKWIEAHPPEKDSFNENNYRMKKRFEYLATVTETPERVYEWNYIWGKSDNTSIGENRAYLSRFIKNITELKQIESFSAVSEFIGEFIKHIEKTPLYDWPFMEEIFSEALNLFKTSQDINKDENHSWLELEAKTGLLIQELTKLMGKYKTDYIYFKVLDKHIEESKDNKKYVEDLLEIITLEIFNLETGDLMSILDDHFPKEWKTTEANIEKNYVAVIWLNNYLQWLQRKLWDRNEEREFDKNLESVTYSLVPTIDPPTWASWLTLLIRPWTDSERVKSHITRVREFGFGSRPLVSSGPHSSEELSDMLNTNIRTQQEITYRLLLKIFPNRLNENELEKLKKEALSIEFDEGTREKLKLEVFMKQLNSLLKLTQTKSSV